MPTRVLIIDDHPLMCEALTEALTAAQDVDFDVTAAHTLADGLQRIAEQGCDVVLLDLGLPGCSGLDALRAVRRVDAQVAVAIVSGAAERRTIIGCLQAGANGFVPKTAAREVMIAALRLIVGGGTYVPPEAVIGEPIDRMLSADEVSATWPPPAAPAPQAGLAFPTSSPFTAASPFAAAARYAEAAPQASAPHADPVGRLAACAARWTGPSRTYPAASASAGPSGAPRPPVDPRQLGLTQRQIDVLGLMLNGLPNKLICRRLQLAEGTVKVHVSAVLRALGVHSRTQAVVAAGRLGLRMDEPAPH